jgi:hypothetical protein
VDVQHRGEPSRLDARRERQIAFDRETVARVERDRRHAGERVVRELGPCLEQQLATAGRAVPRPPRGRLRVLGERDDPAVVAVRPVDDVEVPGAQCPDAVDVRAHGLVQHRPFLARPDERDQLHLARVGMDDDVADVVTRVGREER